MTVISLIVHMVVENFWSHFEASQMKEDMTAYERRRHLREGVRAVIGALDQTAL